MAKGVLVRLVQKVCWTNGLADLETSQPECLIGFKTVRTHYVFAIFAPFMYFSPKKVNKQEFEFVTISLKGDLIL